jgi:mono/diheme cytochrome c family protein
MKVIDHGVLVGEPPHLWLMKDTNGDLKMDTKEEVSASYGRYATGIEHNGNCTLWAMDNTMYTCEDASNLRYNPKTDKFDILPSISEGQWQASQDDAGHIFRNVNDAPLFVDYTQSKYLLRNPARGRNRGNYESLIDQMDATLYPVRPNRGVNRGYRDPFFRKDGSSIVIQGAGSPIVYRGDKYPAPMRGTVWITDSPTNTVHVFNITNTSGKLAAKNTFTREEILTSSDERFRPVNLFSGPDGDMYVVDIYRGVVQDGGIWSDYLREYIKSNNIEMPVARGRIWRIVYGTGPATRGPMPALGSATVAQLVDQLKNPIGWWRDTAQRIIVERRDKSVVPALTAMATAPTTATSDWRPKLHALWTLDGLQAIDVPTVEKALADSNADIRAAAIRISEQWLATGAQPITGDVLKLAGDTNWNVRRQVAASIGEMPAAMRLDPEAAILARDGNDPIIVDAAISSLSGLEADALGRVLAQAPKPGGEQKDAVKALAATLTRAGNVAAVQHIIDMTTEASRAAWQRQSLLEGVDAVLTPGGSSSGRAGGGGRNGGGGGGGGRGGISLAGLSTPGAGTNFTPGGGITLPAEPTALIKLGEGTGEIPRLAKSVANKLDWPGRPAPVVLVTPLTPAQQKMYDAGHDIFHTICAACHQDDGRGKDKVAANLVESKFVMGTDIQAPIKILLSGKEGSIGLMPPLGQTLSDEQIASVITYIRREWGHTASPVSALEVGEVRGLNKARNRPWTDADLTAAPAGRGGGAGGAGRGGAGAPGGAGGRGGAGAPGGAGAGAGGNN